MDKLTNWTWHTFAYQNDSNPSTNNNASYHALPKSQAKRLSFVEAVTASPIVLPL